MQCACAILFSVACSVLPYFSTLSHKRHDFRWKKKTFLNIKCVIWFALLLVFEIQGGAKRTHVPWPPRSPDLSVYDFFLWGYLKSKVYVRKPRTVDDLKVSVREEIAIVPQKMLVNVMQNFEERLRTCVRQEGRHLSDIIFLNWVINVSNQNCIYYRLFWC